MEIFTRVSCTLPLNKVHTNGNLVVARLDCYTIWGVGIATFTWLSRARPSLKLSTYLQKHSKKAKNNKVSLYSSLSFLVFDNSPHQSKPLHFYTAPIPFNRRAKMVSLYKTGETNTKPEGYSTLNPLSASNQEKKKACYKFKKFQQEFKRKRNV